MIVVYPMICSGTIAESTLPAIAKTIERYLIVYYMSELVRDVNDRAYAVGARNFKIKNGKLFLEWDPTAGGGNKYEDERNEREREKNERERQKNEREWEKHGREREAIRRDEEKHGIERDKYERDIEKDKTKETRDAERHQMEKDKIKRGKIAMNVSAPTVDISPTYVTVETPKGSAFVGVKVIAIRVQSDMDFTYYLEKDQDLNWVFATAVGIGRGALRKIYSTYDRFIGHHFGSLTPSGDARHDVIYARSGFSIKGITLVDRNAMSEDFMSSAKHVNRMHGLGWDNIILADDINRYAYFCMQKFRGICNSIPYQMMYRTLGQEQVYDSIEQTRMKNSSLFKAGPKLSKLVGESKAFRKRDNYMWNENQSFLSEMDLTGLMDKISPSRFKSLVPEIKEKAENNNFKGIYNTLHTLGLNDSHMDSAFEKGKETDDELSEAQELARKVMKNSLPHETTKNQKLMDDVSKSIAFTASVINKKFGHSTKKATKHILAEFIPKVRSFYEEQKEEEKEKKRPHAAIYHTIEAAIGIIWIAAWGAFIVGAYILVVTHVWMFLGVLASTLAIVIIVKNLLQSAQQTSTMTTT